MQKKIGDQVIIIILHSELLSVSYLLKNSLFANACILKVSFSCLPWMFFFIKCTLTETTDCICSSVIYILMYMYIILCCTTYRRENLIHTYVPCFMPKKRAKWSVLSVGLVLCLLTLWNIALNFLNSLGLARVFYNQALR